jgi:arsenite oxidase small subunit
VAVIFYWRRIYRKKRSVGPGFVYSNRILSSYNRQTQSGIQSFFSPQEEKMDHKDNDQPTSRRTFLKVSGGVAAGVGTLGMGNVHAATAKSYPGNATLPYPHEVVAKLSALKENVPVRFTYPDEQSPCVLVKMGHPVPGGVGPQNDIVAYSSTCTHMGCPLAYDEPTRTFRCGCHYSVFDAELSGQMVCGQATENLPLVTLMYDDKSGAVSAVAIQGLMYGRQSNIL